MPADYFKISMDDIKDMVSELFGKKIEKIKKQEAKQILNEYTVLKDIEEENICSEIEQKVNEEIQEKSLENKELISEKSIEKSVEDKICKKIEVELREKIKQENEDERRAKRKELLQKLEENNKVSKQEAAIEKNQVVPLGFIEKLTLINLFKQVQKVLVLMLAKLLKREPAEKMFYKTLEKTIEKHSDILRKVNYNQYSKPRMDSSLEVGRLAANLNGLNLSEEQKKEKLFNALREIFEERLIATELALGIDIKKRNNFKFNYAT